MAALGSPEWLAEARDPAAAGLRAQAHPRPVRVQYVVTGTEAGEVRWATEVTADGSVVEHVGSIDDPDVTLTWGLADARALARGEVSPNVSWMRGRTKVVGATGAMLRLLAACKGPAYEAAQAAVAARTD